jgi:Ca2+-binding EF-hand superfamily protein
MAGRPSVVGAGVPGGAPRASSASSVALRTGSSRTSVARAATAPRASLAKPSPKALAAKEKAAAAEERSESRLESRGSGGLPAKSASRGVRYQEGPGGGKSKRKVGPADGPRAVSSLLAAEEAKSPLRLRVEYWGKRFGFVGVDASLSGPAAQASEMLGLTRKCDWLCLAVLVRMMVGWLVQRLCCWLYSDSDADADVDAVADADADADAAVLCLAVFACKPNNTVWCHRTPRPAPPAPGSDLRHLRVEFDRINETETGVISKHELFTALGEDESILTTALFDLIDIDGNGTIDFNEFVQVFTTFCIYSQRDILQFIFSLFDRDNSGALDQTEFIDMVAQLNAQAIFPGSLMKSFTTFDCNSDGLIDFDEFCELSRRYPMMLYPAFRLQDNMQALVGRRRWTAALRYKARRERIEEFKLAHHGELPPEARSGCFPWLRKAT